MAECDWSGYEVRLRAFLVPRTVAPRAAVATTPIDPLRPGPLALPTTTEKALRRTPHPPSRPLASFGGFPRID